MNVSLLAISIGNTRTQLGTFADGKLVATHTLANSHVTEYGPALIRGYEPLRETQAAIVLGSVNPPVSEKIIAQAHQSLPGVRTWRAGSELPIPIGRQLDRESIVGDDRLLNAAAAYDVLKQACVIVDAGTAITIDYIDGAGTFHGGAIGPGAQLMLDSLHHRTALLPEVEFAVPAEPIGHNTHQAMLSAVFYGLRGMVRELVEKYAEVAGSYPMVIATGGNAELLFKDYELVERIVPELTLMGLAVSWQAREEDGDDESADEPPEVP
jgi:type III pantothenate kinase